MSSSQIAEFYADQFAALLPPSRLWPERPDSRFRQLILALSTLLAEAHLAALAVFEIELHPATPFALIGEWEAMLGLPDPCAPQAQTIQERRQRIVAALTLQPRPTLGYLSEVAEALGYTGISITETGPFELTADVPNPRVIYFRTGASRCGDLLGKIERAEDLECLLRRQKPAHIALVFNYSGV
jgi:uncharacterized protein YmfQ (DUF2313 family)